MKKSFATLFCVMAVLLSLAAATPPEKLLPQDTLAVLAIPDVPALRSFYTSSAQWRMWQDPAMKPFKDKFIAKFKADSLEPLEKQLGGGFEDYFNLAQGQFTLAWVRGGDQRPLNSAPLFLLIMDAKDHAKDLETKLAALKKKWTDSAKPIQTEKIRGIEFNTIALSGEELGKAVEGVKDLAGQTDPKQKAPDDPAVKSKPGNKFEITIGQSGSLLIVGTSRDEVEKVLVRQSGGSAPGLDENPAFQSSQNSIFREAPLYFWVNLQPIVDGILKSVRPAPGEPANPMAPDVEKVISAFGLRGLKSAQASMRSAGNGKMLLAGLNLDESGPQGLFKLLSPEPKESRPPVFVPADAVKFSRYRLDLQKTWNNLEKLVRDVYPPAAGALDLIFKNAGKDKDPNYDLRKELVGNLGDDIISYQKAPKSSSPADLGSPPSIIFIASPNAENLLQAIRTLAGMMAPVEFKERDLLGRKIYSGGPANQPSQGINLAANAGYVAISASPELVEEFIRSSDSPRKSLREMTSLAEDADKVGGMETGLFGYDNETESLRTAWDFMRKNSDDVAGVLSSQLGPNVLPGVNAAKMREWVDFSLLPSFDTIAKYLTYSVYSGNFNSTGFTMKFFFPDPPGIK